MSTTFEATVDRWPSHATARRAFATPDLHCVVEEPEDGEWPEGTLGYYREGVSTRVVSVTRTDDRLEVRLNVASCPEDHGLAIAILAALVTDPQATIDSEEYGEFKRSALPEVATAARLAASARAGVGAVFVIAQTRGPVTMDGPVRRYHLGPRLAAELLAGGTADDAADRLFDDMRRVQYGGQTHGRRDPSILEVGGPDGLPPVTMVVWSRNSASILPGHVSAYMVMTEAEPVYVRPASVVEVAGEAFAGWLDETTSLVDAVDGPAWARLVERARAVSFDPLEITATAGLRPDPKEAPVEDPKPHRPWWRFWTR